MIRYDGQQIFTEQTEKVQTEFTSMHFWVITTSERSFSMGNLTRIEQEKIINFNVAESDAVVYTRDKAVMRKIDALVNEFPEIYKCLKVTDIDKTYSVPKNYISYCKSRKISAK